MPMTIEHPSWWDPHSDQPFKLSPQEKPRITSANLIELLRTGLSTAILLPAIAWYYATLKRPSKLPHIKGFVGLGISPEFDSNGICVVSHDKIRKAADPKMVGALRKALLNEGIDTQGGRVWRLSAAHTESNIDDSIEAFEKALEAVRQDGFI